MHCGSVLISVVDEDGIDVFSCGLFLATTDGHVGVWVFFVLPLFGVHGVDFLVYEFLDVGLWYGAVSEVLACSAKLGKLVRSFIAPQSCVGGYPSQFHFVACCDAVDS